MKERDGVFFCKRGALYAYLQMTMPPVMREFGGLSQYGAWHHFLKCVYGDLEQGLSHFGLRDWTPALLQSEAVSEEGGNPCRNPSGNLIFLGAEGE